MLFLGHGTSPERCDSGHVGNVELIAGLAVEFCLCSEKHLFKRQRLAPHVFRLLPPLCASAKSTGGRLLIKSLPEESNSGNVSILTDDLAELGVSGSVSIGTGLSSQGDSGDLVLSIGVA